MAILKKKVHKLRSRVIPSVNVKWKNCPVEEANWEIESNMRRRYPKLFTELGNLPFSSFLLFFLLTLSCDVEDECIFNWYLM